MCGTERIVDVQSGVDGADVGRCGQVWKDAGESRNSMQMGMGMTDNVCNVSMDKMDWNPFKGVLELLHCLKGSESNRIHPRAPKEVLDVCSTRAV